MGSEGTQWNPMGPYGSGGPTSHIFHGPLLSLNSGSIFLFLRPMGASLTTESTVQRGFTGAPIRISTAGTTKIIIKDYYYFDQTTVGD